MRRVGPFLLLLIFPNTFSLQHPAWPWTRAPYPQPLRLRMADDLARPWTRASKRIANEKLAKPSSSKDEINAKIIENMMRLIGMKFNIGKRSTGVKEQPKYDETKKIEVLTKLINKRLKASFFFRYGNLKLKYQKMYLDN